MKKKIRTAKEAIEKIKDGHTIMVGGFMSTGTPEILIDALVAKGVKELTIICNDGGCPGRGVAKLIANRQVKRLIASHVGLNPEVGIQMDAGYMEVQLVPQGTLAERIRFGGAGLGGFLTPTGVGTIVAEGKKQLKIEGVDYLLELPLKADFALVRGSVTDTFGNTIYHKATRNFNPLIATAATEVIVAAEKIVAVGDIPAESVVTSGIFVDYIVGGEKPWQI
jgi:acetate CoA/acetoacetate CoA-transferase alpha subunit